MTILTFPTIRRPSSIVWGLTANTQTQTSPFDGSTQTLRMPGERWKATISWDSLSAGDARILSAFLARLGGRAGRFYFSPLHAPRQATGTGTPLINGSIQTGSTISIKGWAASAQAFKAGDFLSYNDANGRPLLHQVTADSAATGSGFASVSIAPPVRRSVADNTPVEIAAPVAVFMLTRDDDALAIRPPLLGAVSLEIMEALV